MENFWSNFIESLIAGIPNLLTALVIFFVGVYLARVLSNLVRRVLQRRRVPAGVSQLVAELVLWVIVGTGTILALQRFFDVTAFLAGLGILGFAIGFALQDIMKNLAAGVLLLLQPPFHVGETIGVKGFEGTVLKIDLRATEMKAADGRVVILPNADLLANPIINYSRANPRRVDLTINLSYTTEPNVVRHIVLEAIESVPGFVHEPEPLIVFNSLTDHAVEMNINFWINVSKTDPVRAKDVVLVKVKTAFNQQGIEIPHP